MSAKIYDQLLVRYSLPQSWSLDEIISSEVIKDVRLVVFKLGRPSGLGRQFQYRAAAFYGLDAYLMWDQSLSYDQAFAEREDHAN